MLYVTPQGEKLYPILYKELQYSTQVALTGLDHSEMILVNNLLSKVSQNIIDNWVEVKKGYKRKY